MYESLTDVMHNFVKVDILRIRMSEICKLDMKVRVYLIL